MAVNEGKLNNLRGQFVHELDAAMHAPTIVVGEPLGRYKALSGAPATAQEPAGQTQTDPCYLRK